jgi:PAS domain-containing protein
VKSVAIATISPTGSDSILGFFVLGLNPRYPLNEGSAHFIAATSRLLATAYCSVVLLEEEVTRREEMIAQAANIQADLSTRLNAHQKRLEIEERRFEKITSKAHVGIFAARPDGHYTYRNQRWFDIFQIAKDQQMVQHAWSMLVKRRI